MNISQELMKIASLLEAALKIQRGNLGVAYVGNNRYMTDLLFYIEVGVGGTDSKNSSKIQREEKKAIKELGKMLKKEGMSLSGVEYPAGKNAAYYKKDYRQDKGIFQLWSRVYIEGDQSDDSNEKEIEQIIKRLGFQDLKQNPAMA